MVLVLEILIAVAVCYRSNPRHVSKLSINTVTSFIEAAGFRCLLGVKFIWFVDRDVPASTTDMNSDAPSARITVLIGQRNN